MERQEGVFFAHVYSTLLLDDDATIGKLRDNFDDIAKTSTESDYVLVDLVGHGFDGAADGNFHFMVRNASLVHLNATSFNESDFTEPLAGVLGTRILILESCHADLLQCKKPSY